MAGPEPSADLFEAVFESAQDGLLLCDASGRLVRCNARLGRMFGYAAAELVGLPIETLVPAASRGAHVRLRAAYQAAPHPRMMGALQNMYGVHRDGRQVPVDISLTPLQFHGEPVVLAIVRDMTEQRRAEADLRSIIDGSPDAIVVHVDGTIVFATERAAELHGLPIEQLQGRSFLDFVPAELRQAARQRVLGAAAGDAGGVVLEGSLLRPDGTLRAIEGTAIGLSWHGARAVMGILRDVTDRKREQEALRETEERLRQSQKLEAIGRLAAGVAHDFNNLLSVILSYAGLLLGDMPAGDPGRADLAEVQKAAQRGAGLTRQLLAFSRQQMLAPVPLNLNDVVGELATMLRRVLGEDVRLGLALDPTLAPVLADHTQVEQLVMNLAVNARDAMPTGGELSIRTANVAIDQAFCQQHPDLAPGEHVLLSLTDTGTGMDAATQARVFEPFFTTKEKGKGTGLGLATVFGIVQQSRGLVQIDSAPGAGTTFRIYLPRCDEVPRPAEAARQRTPVLPASVTVLLVEDDPGLRLATAGVLVRRGYHVLVAGDATEARRLCAAHPGGLELLLTDVVMPEVAGPALAAELAAVRPGMKVLYISGYTDDEVIRHGLAQGTVAFLQKPFTPETLTEKIQEVLGGPSPGARPA